jgi:hypothetical protein
MAVIAEALAMEDFAMAGRMRVGHSGMRRAGALRDVGDVDGCPQSDSAEAAIAACRRQARNRESALHAPPRWIWRRDWANRTRAIEVGEGVFSLGV